MSTTGIDRPLRDFRRVTSYFKDRVTHHVHIVLAEDVEAMVRATMALHHFPGRNPHNGNKTAQLHQLEVSHFSPRGPFWWTTADLMNNGDPAGATIFEEGSGCTWFSFNESGEDLETAAEFVSRLRNGGFCK